ncbi:MAG: type II toxin-antitoxin system HicB family antitoxin [Candidatus Methanomethylicaceae archaeon]
MLLSPCRRGVGEQGRSSLAGAERRVLVLDWHRAYNLDAMAKARAATLEDKPVKSYTFRVVVEPDPFDNGRMAYHAYVPVLEEKGAATFGYTVEEALANLQEVVRMVLQSMKRHCCEASPPSGVSRVENVELIFSLLTRANLGIRIRHDAP